MIARNHSSDKQLNKLELVVERFDRLRPDTVQFWQRISDSDENSICPFATFAFAKACHLAGMDVRVVELRAAGLPCNLFPFQYSSRIEANLGILDRVGGVMSDFMGFVLPTPTLSLEHFFQTHISAIRLNHYSSDALEAQLDSPTLRLDTRSGWRIVLNSDSQIYLQQKINERRKHFANLENRVRKLTRDYGSPCFIHADSASADDVMQIISTKVSQFERTRVHNIFSNKKNRDLLIRLGTDPAVRSLFRLSRLYSGNELIASHIGLKNGDYFSYWFPTYDIRFNQYSPGLILLREIVESMSSNNIRVFDFGEGDTDYKRVFGNEIYENVKVTMFAPSIRGSFSRLTESIRWRFKPVLS